MNVDVNRDIEMYLWINVETICTYTHLHVCVYSYVRMHVYNVCM